MRVGRRYGLSSAQKAEIWRRWKAGESLQEIGDPQMHLECSLNATAKQSSKTPGRTGALAARLAQTDSNSVAGPIRAEIVGLVYPSNEVRRHQEGELTPARPHTDEFMIPSFNFPRRSLRRTRFSAISPSGVAKDI